ncbi:divalent metal cation transporter [Amycolatopsis sulphurea]|uniref:divalent metal cation transporter n=1 Tax=Amycolatopsis sulphurea TaxID=76022 RepID=UPI0036AB4A67
MLTPLVIALSVSPDAALVASQVVLSFGIPFAFVPLVLITRDCAVMGKLINRRHDVDRRRHRRTDHRAQRLPARPALGRKSCDPTRRPTSRPRHHAAAHGRGAHQDGAQRAPAA